MMMKIYNKMVESFYKYNLGHLAYVIFVSALFLIMLTLHAHQTLMYIPLVLALIPIFIDAIKDLFEKKITTELFLIFATGIALIAHEEKSITVVLLIMLIAKYIEEFIKEKTGKAIESLIRLVPSNVTVLVNNQEVVMPMENVTQGMHILIKTGEQIPVDGLVIDGQASINESFLTGESLPVEKNIKDPVFAGTFVEAGAVIVTVNKVGSETHFGRISQLLEEAEKEKAKIISISNRAGLIIVQLLIIFIGIVWFWTKDLSLVATLLVFGSPIELTMITPLAMLAGTAAALRAGILIKGSIALERFASINTLIFDKTGTLTIGEPKIINIESCNPSFTTDDILKIAAMMERRSGHVLAKAILQKAAEHNLEIPDPQTYESVTGHGIDVTYNNQRYLLGSEHFIADPEHGNVHIPTSLTSSEKNCTETFFYLSCDNELCGRICVADTIRPDAKDSIKRLKNEGIKNIILLSGDRLEVAHHVAQQLGIENVFGEVDPDEKLQIIKELQVAGHRVAMIGDGINDAPALVQADVGIAMGAMGMEPAIQAADIVLMANNLQGVLFIHALARKTLRLIAQNIFIGFAAIHLFGIILALLHLVSPIQAALFHAVSDILILVNSARLIRFKLDT
jgi:heavy metal translocating P-type ATPase